MGWRRGIVTLTAVVHAAVGIAVVDNLLHIMYKVARGLDVLLIIIVVLEATIGTGVLIIVQQRHLTIVRFPSLSTMLILGIDIATAHAWHYIDEVEFHHTGNQTPFRFIGSLCLLTLDFEIHARSQCHLVQAGAIVAIFVLRLVFLPLVVGGAAVCFQSIRHLVGGTNSRVRGITNTTCCLGEEYVAGEVAQVVHHAVDAEVVTMSFVGVSFIAGL